MENSAIWAVDELQARSLMAEVGLPDETDLVEAVARHFARHREAMTRWAAERAQQEIIRSLEQASGAAFSRASDEWIGGFNFAESQVCGVDVGHVVDSQPARPRSQGQILRTMLRQARGA